MYTVEGTVRSEDRAWTDGTPGPLKLEGQEGPAQSVQRAQPCPHRGSSPGTPILGFGAPGR